MDEVEWLWAPKEEEEAELPWSSIGRKKEKAGKQEKHSKGSLHGGERNVCMLKDKTFEVLLVVVCITTPIDCGARFINRRQNISYNL